MNAAHDDDPENILALLLAQYDEAITDDMPADFIESASRILDDALTAEWQSAKDCLDFLDRVRRHWSPGDEQTDDGFGATSQEVTKQPGEARRLGGYQLERQIGAGGLGIVYLAFDPKLGRRVALKVPRIEAFVSSELRERFVREAEAAGRLNHPHIVAVHAAGAEGEICFIATEYLPGQNLAQWMSDRREPVPLALAVALILQLADAVQHAHSRGILHRDIKPSNVLISGDCAKLTDFGMAKFLNDTTTQTHVGTLIGTPAYMAPEQARGRPHDVDVRTDVYALGALLYELLTSRRVIQGDSIADTIRRVISDDPSAPRAIRPEIPRDLEAICLKCLEKPPANRYGTARELADDLARFERGEPTVARPVTRVEAFCKWSRRHPALAGLIAVCILSMITFFALLLWSNRAISTALKQAQHREAEARQYAYTADMQLASDAWETGMLTECRDRLKRHIPQGDGSDPRGIEWNFMWSRLNNSSQLLAQQPTAVWSMALSPDQRILATGDRSGMIRLWPIHGSGSPSELNGHDIDVNALCFSNDGSTLFSAGDDGVRIWDVQTGTCIRILSGFTSWVGCLALAPADDNLLLTGDGDGRLLAWNWQTGQLVHEVQRHDGPLRWILYHPTDAWVLSAADGCPPRISDLQGQPPKEIPDGLLEAPDDPRWRGAIFEPNGTLWAIGSKRILIWDLRAHRMKREIYRSHDAKDASSLAIIPRHSRLLVGRSSPSDLEVHWLSPGLPIQYLLRGHEDTVRSLTILADDSACLSGSEDGTVRRWQLNDQNGPVTYRDMSSPITAIAWHPAGDMLAVAHESGLASLITSTQPVSETKLTELASVRSLAFTSDGHELLIVGSGKLQRWDWQQQTLLGSTTIDSSPKSLTLSTNDRSVLYYTEDSHALVLMDRITGVEQWRHVHPETIWAIALSADGQAYSACQDNWLRSFDVNSGKLLREYSHSKPVRALDISSDGGTVAASVDNAIHLHDASTLQIKSTFSSTTQGDEIGFLDRDRRLILRGSSRLALMELDQGRSLMTVARAINGRASSLEVNSRGDNVAVASENHIAIFRFVPAGVPLPTRSSP
jgi:WD40 repeat protein